MIIKIPFKTPTINHLYGRHARGFMFVKKEAKKLKEDIKEIVNRNIGVKGHNLNEKRLKVEVEIHENWFTLKKEVARKDVANREKFLIDAVFDAIGIDDKFIFEHTMKKVQDSEEYALIEINAL